MVLLLYYSFKRQNMAGACAEAGAEIMEKGGAGVGAENKFFQLRNTGKNYWYKTNCTVFFKLT